MLIKSASLLIRFLLQSIRCAEGAAVRILSLLSAKKNFYGYRPSMLFLPGSTEGADMRRIYDPDLSHRCIREADRILAHCFPVLGAEPAQYGSDIDWSLDFRSGFRWPQRYFKLIRSIGKQNRADIKWPWELSRFHHLTALGKAFSLTGNPKYTLEFQQQIRDWIQKNPAEFSVNWICAMEAAIRAVNWIAGWFFFRDGNLDSDFTRIFFRSLFEHGLYIEKHLERFRPHGNNHIIADYTGLVWLGLFFKDSKEAYTANRWLLSGLNGLQQELFSQVYADGSHCEMSTYYQKYVAEMSVVTTIVCRENQIRMPEKFDCRLAKMCEMILITMKPDGLSPLIGDMDNGRFLLFSSCFNRCPRDFRHVLAAAGGYFRNTDFLSAAADLTEDLYFTAGCIPEAAVTTSYTLKTYPVTVSESFPCSGLYLLRNDRLYCLFNCRPHVDEGLRGHIHQDRLGFVLQADHCDIVDDPGTCVYTGNGTLRNLFRSTRVHSTLSIEGYEQTPYVEERLFDTLGDSLSECTSCSHMGISGSFFGYGTGLGLIHHRELVLLDNGLYVTDRITGRPHDSTDASLRFTLGSGIRAEPAREGMLLRDRVSEVCMLFESDLPMELCDVFISPQYGVMTESKQIVIKNVPYNQPIRTAFRFE